MEVWQYSYIMETQKFNKTLLGNVALVTGGSRGVGLSIALELAKRGCDICFTYLKDHNSATIAHEQLLGVIFALDYDVCPTGRGGLFVTRKRNNE